MAWLTGWDNRKSHIINAQAGAGSNYPVKVMVHYGYGTDSNENVYCGTKCRTDFGDIRFTDSSGETLLDCWMDSKTTSDNAVFIVKIAGDLSSTAQTIYIYFGNIDASYPYLASAKAHGQATFQFFENLEDLNLGDINGQNSWIADETADVENSTVHEGARALQIGQSEHHEAEHTVSVDGYKCFLQVWMRADAVSGNYAHAQIYLREDTNGVAGISFSDSEMKHLISPQSWETFNDASSNTWYKLKVALTSSTQHKVWLNDVEQTLTTLTNMTEVSSAVNNIWLEHYNGSSYAYFDEIIVGKYVYPEPTHGDWGTEDSNLEVTGNLAVDYESLLPGNVYTPKLTGSQILSRLWRYDAQGEWAPYDFETGTNYQRFQGKYYVGDQLYSHDLNLFVILRTDDNYAPLLVTDEGFIVKKDLAVGGFISSQQGELWLGHGRLDEEDDPKINLLHSDDGFDTLYLRKSNAETPAHLDLGDLTANGTVQAAGYKSSDETSGATDDVVISGTTLHFKNGLFVGSS